MVEHITIVTISITNKWYHQSKWCMDKSKITTTCRRKTSVLNIKLPEISMMHAASPFWSLL